MSGFLGIDSNREVIRVFVKKCDGLMQPETKRFSVDPQITNFEMLQNILARAFDIKSDFSISYLSKDEKGNEVYLSMLSDWDMDAAFQNASDPTLRLKVDLKPFDEALEDWDIIAPMEIPQYKLTSFLQHGTFLGNITGTISNHMEKTMSHVQKAIGIKTEEEPSYKPTKAPMTDLEFRNYLDSDGKLVKPEELRLSIYQGGIEPSLRRVVWRHLLNIYPTDMSGKQRFDYMKRKEQEYLDLRDQWKKIFSSGKASEEAKHVASMVKKDVLRTDRTHKFYAGNDESKNLHSLYHLLVTFALTHPEISYCQGMSDLASPLLVVQKEEAQAYLCFCGLMKRMRSNFRYSGEAITTKFTHLSELLKFYDPTFHMYLKEHGAEDLFFCYRWLLLEMKREFPFDDALYMLEVMWSTLPPNPPDQSLELVDIDFVHSLLSLSPHSPTFSIKQNLYAHLLAKRRLSTTPHKEVPITSPRAKKHIEEELSRNSVNNNSRMSAEDSSCKVTSPYSPEQSETLRNHVVPPEPMERFPSLISASLDDIEEEAPTLMDSVEVIHSLPGSVDEIQAGYQEDMFKFEDRDSGAGMSNSHRESDVEDEDVNQFHLSLEENEKPKPVESKKIPEIKGSFFSGMKKILSSPKKKPTKNLTLNVGKSCGVKRNGGVVKNGGNGNGTSAIKNPTTTSGATKSSAGTAPGAADNKKVSNGPNLPVLEQTSDSVQFDRRSKSTDSGNVSDSSSPSDTASQTVSVNSSTDSGKASNLDNILLASQREYEEAHFVSRGQVSCENPALHSATPQQQTSSCSAVAGNVVKPDGESQPVNNDAAKSTNEEKLSDCVEVTDDQELHCSGLKQLPPPNEFGFGNPFLMFLCLTVLLQHRDIIMKNQMEYDELAMYFDRMVRKHHVHKVLAQTRSMYTDYIRMQQTLQLEDTDNCDFNV